MRWRKKRDRVLPKGKQRRTSSATTQQARQSSLCSTPASLPPAVLLLKYYRLCPSKQAWCCLCSALSLWQPFSCRKYVKGHM